MDLSQLQDFLDVAPDAMCAVAAGRIEAANGTLGALFGHAPEELPGQLLQTLIPEPSPSLDPDASPWRASGPLLADQEGRHRDGTRFPIEVSARRICLDTGTPVMLVGVRDITVRESLRKRALEAHRLDHAGQLARGISHDFNNLLTVILCNCSLLADTTAEPERRDLVGEIQAAATHAVSLSRQIVLRSRVPPGQTETLDLRTMLRRVRPMLERLLGLDIEFSLSFGDDQAVVRAVPSQVEQILVHLILNARDALPGGGHVTMRVAAAPPAAERGEAHTRIEILDDGVGMSEDVAARAFAPYFSTKTDGKGTGLGLPMVAELVAASRGAVHLHSTPGVGTRCQIDLPRAAGPLPNRGDGVAAIPNRQRPGTEVVVLVVPSAAARKALGRLLAGHGLVVLEAPDAARGVAHARSLDASPDLIVVDEDAPDSSSLPTTSDSELLRRAREDLPGAAFLLLTSHADLDAAPPGPEFTRIAKPFDPGELLRTIDRVLDAVRG